MVGKGLFIAARLPGALGTSLHMTLFPLPFLRALDREGCLDVSVDGFDYHKQ